MIVKLIQNLEIKMESEINSLETRIEKMQEGYNKDLEEIKKSKYIMNNAINEIKNTLEATNSRITEAEEREKKVTKIIFKKKGTKLITNTKKLKSKI